MPTQEINYIASESTGNLRQYEVIVSPRKDYLLLPQLIM